MGRPFLETLGTLRHGRTLEDLGDELTTLIAAIKTTGKGGSLTLTLKIKPARSGAVQYVTIEDQIVSKCPKLEKGDTVYFTTSDNGLTRQDPTQTELPLRGVAQVTIDKTTGEVLPAGSAQ